MKDFLDLMIGMFLFIMLAQNVFAEIISQIANNTVNMVGVVLCIVKFNQQHRPLNAIIMAGSRFKTARPRKRQFFDSGILDLGHKFIRESQLVVPYVYFK